MGIGLYFRHASSLEHDPREYVPAHPDTPERIVAIEHEMASVDWLGFDVVDAPLVTDAALERVHSTALVEAIRKLAMSGGGPVDADTFVGEASFRAALYAAGGACQMVERLLDGDARLGFCGLRPAGHHAECDRAMGFCLFNNVAIAAESAIVDHGLERVFVLDWDVHHGNGTAEIFRHRSDVLFASIHQRGIYPGTGRLTDPGSGVGEGHTINLPVYAGSDGEVWLSLLEYIILPAAFEFRPQLVLISAGFDAHRLDPVGGCMLESADFAQMGCQVRDVAASLGAPVGAVLEGGYDLGALADGVIAMLTALSGVGEAESIAPDPILTSRAAAQFGQYWSL